MSQQGERPDDDGSADQLEVRLDKRARLLDKGLQPYPADLERTHLLAEVRERWGHLGPGEETDEVVAVAGRVMYVRNTGKLAFATLQGAGPEDRLQVMLSLGEVGQEAFDDWKELVDIGDQVLVRGRVITSRRGELSVFATSWAMAAKALRPLPTLHKELSPETRVRQRYVDLIVREEARESVRARALVLRAVRETLDSRGFVEVETPILQLIHGGAKARPFVTHMNAFDQRMTLRIALELNLKKVVVGGFDRVYEMGRIFRNEGSDATHSPEFTMLEVYQAYGDQTTVADLTRDLFLAAGDALGTRVVQSRNGEVDLDVPWEWLPVHDALSAALGQPVDVDTPTSTWRELADQHEVKVEPDWAGDAIALELLGELVEPQITTPTFLCDYPAIAQPLARPHRSKPGLIEAWDLIIGGVEIGTGFTELVDPVVQREVLTQQSLLAAGGDPEAMELDEDFLEALEHGAPPMGGLGFGVDRLLMLFTGANIRETLLFPHLRPRA